MSRSIHSTRNDYRREQQTQYGKAAEGRSRLYEIREELRKKRRIKQQVRRRRQVRAASQLPPVRPESIPVDILDQGPWIHYPAGQKDLYEIMERLPAGALNGLSKVRLCLGSEYQEEELSDEDRATADRDPWLGRVGFENLPGVFGGRILGTYWDSPPRIDLYAYVYDSTLADRTMWELYLRLQMLSTFVHEVAHHEDNMQRVARGRWRMDDPEKNEDFAETMQAAWVRQYVAPYLYEVFQDDVRVFNEWVQRHGGVALPLDLIAGPWRWDDSGKVVPVYFGSAREAIEQLATVASEQSDLTATRLQFARELHYGENYRESLSIIGRVLNDQPDNLEATTLQADIFVHQEKYEEAERLARQVVEQNEAFTTAWQVLADIYQVRQDWMQLKATADRGLASVEDEPNPRAVDWRRAAMMEHRVRANLELLEYKDLEHDLTALSHVGGRYARLSAAYRSLMLLRQGRFAEAIQLAEANIVPRKHFFLLDQAICLGVRCEASLMLNRIACELENEVPATLRRHQFGDWADRLALRCMSPAYQAISND